jgi:hypothetical protein
MRTSVFMPRTYQVFRHQQLRAKKSGKSLDYNLEDLRQLVEQAVSAGGTCLYCVGQLTFNNFSCDHDLPISRGGTFELANCIICCRSWKKQT